MVTHNTYYYPFYYAGNYTDGVSIVCCGGSGNNGFPMISRVLIIMYFGSV